MLEKGPARVLILDDEEMYRLNIADYISDEGFIVYTAGSGEEALELIKKQRIDVALVDMRLPGIDGNTFISHAQKIQPRMQFIIHTGSTSYSLPGELREIGVRDDRVFLKPLEDIDKLVKVISTLGEI
jgi:two-component system, OmpR family, response regulator